jgi:hypothetical protein
MPLNAAPSSACHTFPPRLRRLAHPLATRHHARRAHRHAEEVVHRLAHLAGAHAIAPVQDARQGRGVRAVACAILVGQVGAHRLRALGAAHGVHLVLSDVRLDGRNLIDLVAVHRRGVGQVGRQGSIAMGAFGRAMRDDLIDLVGRHEFAAVAFVSGLPSAGAWFAARGAGWLRWRVGGVGGRRFRGVAGVLVEAGFEVGDARLLCFDEGEQRDQDDVPCRWDTGFRFCWRYGMYRFLRHGHMIVISGQLSSWETPLNGYVPGGLRARRLGAPADVPHRAEGVCGGGDRGSMNILATRRKVGQETSF